MPGQVANAAKDKDKEKENESAIATRKMNFYYNSLLIEFRSYLPPSSLWVYH